MRANLLCLLIFVVLTSGCAAVLVGGGVFAISEDTVEAATKYSESHSYSKSLEVMKGYGNITTSDREAGHIKADVEKDTVEVWIVPDPEQRNGSKVRVKARTLISAFPKIERAKEVLNTILRRL